MPDAAGGRGVEEHGLHIAASKPNGKVAGLLREIGIDVQTLEEDEGNVDRYVLSRRVAVERRTGSSFLRGIQDKTLFTSAIYLREHFRVPILIVEGQVDFAYSMFEPQAIRGAVSSMMILYGLNVLATPTLNETVGLIAMLARHEQVGIPDISLIPKRKAMGLDDLQRRVVEMLPGAGMVVARALLQAFGSVRRIANATEDELRSVRGIGAKKARDMLRVLGADYASVDTERDLEDAIEADPSILFDEPAELIARQLYIFTEEGERQFVDMAYLLGESRLVVLVELKRGRLGSAHRDQLRRYLDHAEESRALAAAMAEGYALHGLLATVAPGNYRPRDADIDARVVDRKAAIGVLCRLRAERLRRIEAGEA